MRALSSQNTSEEVKKKWLIVKKECAEERAYYRQMHKDFPESPFTIKIKRRAVKKQTDAQFMKEVQAGCECKDCLGCLEANKLLINR